MIKKTKTILHQSEEAYSYYIRPMPDSTISESGLKTWKKYMHFLGGANLQMGQMDFQNFPKRQV